MLEMQPRPYYVVGGFDVDAVNLSARQALPVFWSGRKPLASESKEPPAVKYKYQKVIGRVLEGRRTPMARAF